MAESWASTKLLYLPLSLLVLLQIFSPLIHCLRCRRLVSLPFCLYYFSYIYIYIDKGCYILMKNPAFVLIGCLRFFFILIGFPTEDSDTSLSIQSGHVCLRHLMLLMYHDSSC